MDLRRMEDDYDWLENHFMQRFSTDDVRWYHWALIAALIVVVWFGSVLIERERRFVDRHRQEEREGVLTPDVPAPRK